MKYLALIEAALHAPPAVVAAVAALCVPSKGDVRLDVQRGEAHVVEWLRSTFDLSATDAQDLAAALTRRFPRVPAKVAPDATLVRLLAERLAGGWTARALAEGLGEGGVPISAAALHELAAGTPGVYPARLEPAPARLDRAPLHPDDPEVQSLLAALRRAGPASALSGALGALHPVLRSTGERALGLLVPSLDAGLTDHTPPTTAEVLAESHLALTALRVLVRLTQSSAALSAYLHDLAGDIERKGDPGDRRQELLSILALPETEVLAALSVEAAPGAQAPGPDLQGRQVLLVGGETQGVRDDQRRRPDLHPIRRHGSASRAVSSVRRADIVVIRGGLISHAARDAVVREAGALGVPVAFHDGALRPERLVADVQGRLRAASLATVGAS